MGNGEQWGGCAYKAWAEGGVRDNVWSRHMVGWMRWVGCGNYRHDVEMRIGPMGEGSMTRLGWEVCGGRCGKIDINSTCGGSCVCVCAAH